MKQTRLTALFLSLCMTLPMAACTGNAPETEAEETKDTTEISTDLPESGTETQTEAETEPYINLYEDLGEADFNEYEFRILFTEEKWARYELMEDYMGDPVDNAIFEANAKVMDLANINLVPVYTESPSTAMRAANNSGDLFFDVASDHDITIAGAALTDALNLYKLPNINWEGKWWPQYTLDALTLGDTMLMYSNYASYFTSASVYAIFANMDLIDQYGMEHPHDLLNQNRWTIDQLISMTKNANDDVNGDGIMDQENDIWGFSNVSYIYCYFDGWNVEIYDKTEDGQALYVNVGEEVANIMEKMYGWFCESPGVFHSPDPFLEITEEIMFGNKNSIFAYMCVEQTEDLMDTSISYAILPLPKLDETVPEYYSGTQDRPHCVPKAYPKDQYDMLGYILEAMAISGYERIYPAYVETALKYRYSPTEGDSKVIDMLFQNRILSFSWLYSNYMFPRMMDDLLSKDTFTYSSYIAQGLKRNEAWVKRLQDKMLDLGEN